MGRSPTNVGYLAAEGAVAAIIAVLGSIFAAWEWSHTPGQWSWPLLRAAAVGVISVIALLVVLIVLAARIRRATREAARLRAALEEAFDGLLIVDQGGKVIAASPQTEALLGRTRAELIGQPTASFLFQGLPEASAPGPSRGREAGREAVGRRKDGSDLALEVTRAPLAPGDGAASLLLLRDVTPARQTRETLRAHEAHVRLVVDQMPAILWTTDSKLRITSTVGAGLAAVNVKPSELIGMSMLESLGKEDLEATPIAAHLGALRGASLSYEMEWKDRTFQVRVEPLRDSYKKITGTIGILLDITERKQTVAELKARARQQAVVAALGQRAMAGAELSALMDEAASAVCDTLGVEHCAVLELRAGGTKLCQVAGRGWGLSGTGPVPFPAGHESQEGYAVLSRSPVLAEDLATETRFRSAPLPRDHGAVSGMSALVASGRKAHGVISVYTSRQRRFTTDDLNFLQSLANVLATVIDRAQAEQAQQRLVAILEATPDLVAIARPDHRLLYLNRAGRALLGIADDDSISSHSVSELYPEQARAALLERGIPEATRKGPWTGETVLRSRAGALVPASQVIVAHRGTDGALQFLSIIARDVSERQRLEEQLRQAQKMEAIGRLAGGIAHDFNNLLCVIAGYGDLLTDETLDDPARGAYAQEIKKAADRAAALTGQLLAFSRKQMLVPRVLSSNALIEDIGPMLHRLLGEDVELVTQLAPDLSPVKADPGQLQQVVVNLAVNARDAMPEGGRLTLSTRNVHLSPGDLHDNPEAAGSYVLLEVSDTGCGISPEVRAHLFEPFFTTKEKGKGTGLGLATVFGIVKQSEGTIAVQSDPGHGTTFRIYLPATDAPAAAAPTAPQTVAGVHGTETILLVEDEDGVRALAREVLHQRGYVLLEARDARQALALARQHPVPIHLLLTDVVMPGMSGTALAREFTALHPTARVLFMSGFTDSVLLRHGVMTGNADCLLKPFTPDALAQRVREALDDEPLNAEAQSPAYC